LSLSPEERKDVSARNGDAGLHDAQLRKAMLMVRLTQFSFDLFMGQAVAGVTRQCSDMINSQSSNLLLDCLLLGFFFLSVLCLVLCQIRKCVRMKPYQSEGWWAYGLVLRCRGEHVGAKVEQKEIDLSTLSKKELRKHLRQQKKLKKAQGKCFHRSFVLFNRVSMLTCFWTCSILFYLVLSCSTLFYLVLPCSTLFYLVLSCSLVFKNETQKYQKKNQKTSVRKDCNF
jgi:hypothetical protein